MTEPSVDASFPTPSGVHAKTSWLDIASKMMAAIKTVITFIFFIPFSSFTNVSETAKSAAEKD